MATLRLYLERDAELPPAELADLYHPDRLSAAGLLIASFDDRNVILAPNVTLRMGRIAMLPSSGHERRRLAIGSAQCYTTCVDVADVIDDVAHCLANRYPKFVEIVH